LVVTDFENPDRVRLGVDDDVKLGRHGLTVKADPEPTDVGRADRNRRWKKGGVDAREAHDDSRRVGDRIRAIRRRIQRTCGGYVDNGVAGSIDRPGDVGYGVCRSVCDDREQKVADQRGEQLAAEPSCRLSW